VRSAELISANSHFLGVCAELNSANFTQIGKTYRWRGENMANYLNHGSDHQDDQKIPRPVT